MKHQIQSMVYRVMFTSFAFNEKLLDSLLEEHYTLTARSYTGFLFDNTKISKYSMLIHFLPYSYKDSSIYGVPHPSLDISTLVTNHEKLVKDSLFLVQEFNRLILTNKKDQLLYSVPKDALATYTSRLTVWKDFVKDVSLSKPSKRDKLSELIEYYYTMEVVYGLSDN